MDDGGEILGVCVRVYVCVHPQYGRKLSPSRHTVSPPDLGLLMFTLAMSLLNIKLIRSSSSRAGDLVSQRHLILFIGSIESVSTVDSA